MPFDGTHFTTKSLNSRQASNPQSGHAYRMLTEIYIEALLTDEDLADQAWDAGEIDEAKAWVVWQIIITRTR